MELKACPDCHRLRERLWELSAEHSRSGDEVKMTKKNAADYESKKADVQRLKGLLKDARIQLSIHTETHRVSS
jgi:hypothetical protein